MNHIDLIGYTAGVFTTIAFVPQITKVWQTRQVKDISLGMYVILVTGAMLWLTYGVFCKAWPMIIANGFTLLLSSFILIMKLRYETQEPKRKIVRR